MTENEAKAVRFIENIKNHATVTLDHIVKEEPNVSPLFYKGREEKANTILVMVEELKQYRAIGTPEECRAAVEKQKEKSPIRLDKMSEELKPCPFCGHSIDIEKDVYEPSRDWHPTFIDPDSGGDPINIHCKCGLEFCTGTYDWGEFVEAWNRRKYDGKTD